VFFDSRIGSTGTALETCSDHFRKYRGTASDTHLDHDQAEKRVHRVGADLHSMRYLFAGKALQQKLHRLSLPWREFKLLGDPRKKEQFCKASFKKKLKIRVRGASEMPVQLKDPAAITPLSRYKLGHET
jgi:hypothetical protein